MQIFYLQFITYSPIVSKTFCCHVKGHQDGKYISVLSRDAWLNIEADQMACDAITQAVPGH